MVRKTVQILNEIGMHMRPASMLVNTAIKFDSDIFFEKDGQRINAKSIMGVLMLAAGKGTKIEIIADGTDAREAVSALEELFGRKFDEE